jgi:haloalkane dehalogenase
VVTPDIIAAVDPRLRPFWPGRFVDTPAGRQHVVDAGHGHPVVMLHGNPTWSFYFRNVVVALAGSYRCVVPDHIGCGLSDKPGSDRYDYALKSRIDDLERLLDALGVTDPVTLIVHDWGGMIGMGYAARHPDRIRRIVAINTGCTRLPAAKSFPFTLNVARNTKLGEWLILRHNFFCRSAAKWCTVRKPLSPTVREAYLAPYDSPANRIAVLKFVQTIPFAPSDPGFDIVESAERIAANLSQVPVMLLWGLKDFVFDQHFLAAWQSQFPHAETHAWPDGGHYLLDDYADEAIPKIVEFLGRP